MSFWQYKCVSASRIMKVLIAINDEATFEPMLNFIFQNKWKNNPEFLLVSVVEPVMVGNVLSVLPSALLSEIRSDLRAAAERTLRHFALKLRDEFHTDKVKEIVEEGQAGPMVVERAKLEAVDLIIVASHQRKGLDRMVLGSVSSWVTAHADCAVLVIDASERFKRASYAQSCDQQNKILENAGSKQ